MLKWFSNLKLKVKLLLAFACLIVFTTIVGVVNINSSLIKFVVKENNYGFII